VSSGGYVKGDCEAWGGGRWGGGGGECSIREFKYHGRVHGSFKIGPSQTKEGCCEEPVEFGNCFYKSGQAAEDRLSSPAAKQCR